jgi:hypothetical protein
MMHDEETVPPVRRIGNKYAVSILPGGCRNGRPEGY